MIEYSDRVMKTARNLRIRFSIVKMRDQCNLKIENIDFKSGVVSDLEVKDRGKTTTKQGYFPRIIRDIIFLGYGQLIY